MLIGGFIFGTNRSNFAFGASLTGFPFCQDLLITNIIAFTVWILAVARELEKGQSVGYVIASIVTI
jgi:hypothetical protein